MTIKELIEVLSMHPNQNAHINIKANPSNEGEDEDKDIDLNEIEVWGEDDFQYDYIDLFCYNRKTN